VRPVRWLAMNATPTSLRHPMPAGGRSRLVIVPGLHGSGDAHWPSWLHGEVEGSVRVEQDFWNVPDIERWADRIAETVDALGPGPHVLVAHSFGCLAALHATSRYPALGVAQVLLVAPAEPTRFNVANTLPQSRLAMPTCMVASDNDPWMAAGQAHEWAQRWGSDWINLGNAGHINVDSGYGPFPLAREWATVALRRIETWPLRRAA
jgi:predicted alpha/beta hydrolase family esterase